MKRKKVLVKNELSELVYFDDKGGILENYLNLIQFHFFRKKQTLVIFFHGN
jgi:hypothetical protein